jgi:putative transposase
LFYVQNVGEIKVKYHRPLPDDAVIKQVIIKRRNRKWYVCLQLEQPDPVVDERLGPEIGIDMGLHHLLALSDGQTEDNPRWLREALADLRVVQRRVSRRVKGSHRRRKAAFQVAKLHEHIAHQRRDFWHKLTRHLVETYGLIALEDLPLKFMIANPHLALSAHDASLGEFRQLLAYKAAKAGTQVVTVNPAYTSQRCSGSGCDKLVEKDLSVRVHCCPHCGLTLDRDVNAARNILARAFESARTGRSGANVAGYGERSLGSFPL